MGLGTSEDIKNHTQQEVLMFIASVIFYCVILNLIIATINQQYSLLEGEASMRVQQERNELCYRYLLSQQKLRLRGTNRENKFRVICLRVFNFSCFLVSIFLLFY